MRRKRQHNSLFLNKLKALKKRKADKFFMNYDSKAEAEKFIKDAEVNRSLSEAQRASLKSR